MIQCVFSCWLGCSFLGWQLPAGRLGIVCFAAWLAAWLCGWIGWFRFGAIVDVSRSRFSCCGCEPLHLSVWCGVRTAWNAKIGGLPLNDNAYVFDNDTARICKNLLSNAGTLRRDLLVIHPGAAHITVPRNLPGGSLKWEFALTALHMKEYGVVCRVNYILLRYKNFGLNGGFGKRSPERDALEIEAAKHMFHRWPNWCFMSVKKPGRILLKVPQKDRLKLPEWVPPRIDSSRTKPTKWKDDAERRASTFRAQLPLKARRVLKTAPDHLHQVLGKIGYKKAVRTYFCPQCGGNISTTLFTGRVKGLTGHIGSCRFTFTVKQGIVVKAIHK